MAFCGLLALVSLCINSALGETNVYGKPMTDCGSHIAGGCTYDASDAGAHQVCVTKLPQGFSSDTGQGPWSNSFTGHSWCICIWAYSNYILQNKDLPLKCESIPAKVLEEQYSLDKFKQCGSMSSRAGCGAEDIRRSIQSLCQQCDVQTTDTDAKATLKTKCAAILASAPAAPTQRLYEEPPRSNVENVQGLSSYAFGMCGLVGFVIVVLSVGVLRRTPRRSANFEQDQDQCETLDSLLESAKP